MEQFNVTLNAIGVRRERLRVLRPDKVDAIAESMKAQGQLQEIVVRRAPGRGFWLIAGHHRLEAAKKLKMSTLRCVVLDDDDADKALLAEIDENLIRAELTPAEQALHISKREEIYVRINGKAKANSANAANKKMGHNVNAKLASTFAENTAKKTGKSLRKVQRDVQRGKKVKVLTEIAGTSLDSGIEIDALAKLDESEQRDLAERAKAGEQVSAKKEDNAAIVPTFDVGESATTASPQIAEPDKASGVTVTARSTGWKPRTSSRSGCL